MRKLIILCAVLTASSASAQIRVAVENGALLDSSAAAVAAQLNDDTYFDFTATVVTASQIDSLAELSSYDVVVLGTSGTSDDTDDWTPAMASALRQWVEAGHGAVATGWFNYDVEAGDPFASDLEAIFPTNNIVGDDENNNIDAPIHFINSIHPVTAGLTDFAPTLGPSSCCIELSTLPLEANDVALANDGASNRVIVAVKDPIGSGGGRTVYLGPLYFGSTGYSDAIAALRTGQADRLLEQAVAFAAGALAGPAPVPTASPFALGVMAAALGLCGAIFLRMRG